MNDQGKLPRLYRDLADWWPVLSSPEDYAEEATWYRQAILSVSSLNVQTVLELGSGGGNIEPDSASVFLGLKPTV